MVKYSDFIGYADDDSNALGEGTETVIPKGYSIFKSEDFVSSGRMGHAHPAAISILRGYHDNYAQYL